MIPNNTPAISRYNATIKFNGANWILETEHFNTLGTVTITGLTQAPRIQSEDGLFTLNKTSFKYTFYRAAGSSYFQIVEMTASEIELYSLLASAADDRLLIEIEVFNNQQS